MWRGLSRLRDIEIGAKISASCAIGLIISAGRHPKCIAGGDREAFLAAVERADRQVRTLCVVLADAGCRL